LFDTIFALLHLAALLGVLAYAVLSIVRGNTVRFVLIVVVVGAYYYFVLHPAVLKEMARRRAAKLRK
jgi:hypothetical protein